jgi:phosphoribosyl-ATP pyrophosphohydrolase
MVAGKAVGHCAGDPLPLAKRLALAGRLTVIDMDAALGKGDNREIILEMVRRFPCRVGGGIDDGDTAMAWLDAGAEKVIIGRGATKALLAALPRERVVVALDVKAGEITTQSGSGDTVFDRMEAFGDLAGEFLVTVVDKEGSLAGIDMTFVGSVADAAGKKCRVTVAGGIATPAEVGEIDRLGADAQVGMALQTGKLDLGEAIAAPLKSDRPDGLFATIVADVQGQALGLVYSDLESIKEAVKRGLGAYHSRSRGLWVKGLTSGNTQTLHAVKLDCDRDALLFVVGQEGAGFCHNDTWTCFGEDFGLPRLSRTIESRRSSAPEGSYTKRLLDDSGLLNAKLVEEAGELAAAEGKEAVAREAADLIYFTLTAMARAGVSLADVEKELLLRSRRVTRRSGDAK